VIARRIWSALLALLLTGFPAMEAAASAPTMACSPTDKAAAPSMTCMSCCLLPPAVVVIRAPDDFGTALRPAAVLPMTGIAPKATSPPPRPVRV